MIDPNIINFEEHAKTRMKERKITKEMVLATISFPDECRSQGDSSQTI